MDFFFYSFKVEVDYFASPLQRRGDLRHLSPFKGVPGQSSGNEIQLAVLRDWSSRRGRDKVEQRRREALFLAYLEFFFFFVGYLFIVKMRELGVVGNRMRRAQFICEASSG